MTPSALSAYYSKHDPEKAGEESVAGIIAKYDGKTAKLARSLSKKYGGDLPATTPRYIAPAPGSAPAGKPAGDASASLEAVSTEALEKELALRRDLAMEEVQQ